MHHAESDVLGQVMVMQQRVSLGRAILDQAAGTADTLKELGSRSGMHVRVMDLLGDASNADGNVSSSEASFT